MAAISFPPTPSINDIYTNGTRTWKWTGSVWATVPTQYQPILSDTAPTNPYTGMIWVDTTTMVEYTYYSSQWIQLPTGAGSSLLLYMPVGTVLQTVYAENGAYTTITANIPMDDTIPQLSSEGTTILTASITPSSANNKVLIRTVGFAGGYSSKATLAYFRNSTENAIYAAAQFPYGYTLPVIAVGEYLDSPATTSSTLYTVKFGANSNNVDINGISSARGYGGVAKWTLILQEIKG